MLNSIDDNMLNSQLLGDIKNEVSVQSFGADVEALRQAPRPLVLACGGALPSAHSVLADAA